MKSIYPRNLFSSEAVALYTRVEIPTKKWISSTAEYYTSNSLQGTIFTSIIEYVDEQTPADVLDAGNLSSTNFDRAIELMATRETGR